MALGWPVETPEGQGRRRPWAGRCAALSVGLIIFAAPWAGAQTLSDALASAVRNSASMETQRQVIRGQDEVVEQARAGMRPSLSLDASAGASVVDNSEAQNVSRTKPTSIGATATQNIYDGGQTSNAVNSTIATVRSAEAVLIQTEQTVLLDALTAYVNVLAAEENVQLARNNVRVIGEALEAAQDRFEVGEVTRTDVAQAQASLAEARANLTAQIGTLRQARVTYRREVGLRPGKLAALPPLPKLPKSLKEAFDISRANHPSIASARFNVDSASAAVRQSQGALLPQVAAQGSVQADSESVNETSGVVSASAAITVTVPLISGGSLRSQVYQAQALADQRRAELATTTRDILEAVGIAWEDLITSRAQISSNREQIRAARIALEGVKEEAKVGARTTLDVLDAEQDVLDAETDLVTSRSQEYIAAYTVLSSIGKLTAGHLGLDVPSRARAKPAYAGSKPLGRALPKTEDTKWRHNWRP